MTGTGPMCRCGERNTRRIGESALLRMCQRCCNTYAYRIVDGALLPYAIHVAQELDESRRRRLE